MSRRRSALPIFRFDKAFGIARDIKTRLEYKQKRSELKGKRWETNRAKSELNETKSELKRKRQESRRIRKQLRATEDENESSELKESRERVQQEILLLDKELRAAKERRAGSVPDVRQAPQAASEHQTGALPGFVIIGTMKGGTTYLYHLLTLHPLVEPAAAKELQFFNRYFDEGVEWYRQCFPVPRWEDGRRTITGEATPGYLPHPLVPERMARIIPQARLIALLRNPVDRTFSDYKQVTRKGRESRTFEEAMGYANLDDAPRKFLSKSIYVDQLLRWSEFFPREQMLVLKSEDFFEDPAGTLKPVLSFLGLPEWKPKVWDLHYKRNRGDYEGGMDPATRERLEEYFEPHNKRLYDYLGQDFGW
jgi:hypothetical protein